MSVILFLEDTDYMREHTANLLKNELETNECFKSERYTVKPFFGIDQAKEYFSKHEDEIGCIVTDLNMSEEFLGEYRHESCGRKLSGWVWLNRFVFTKKPHMPTVIYSGFLSELKTTNISHEQYAKLKNGNIQCVAKGSDEGQGFKGLINAIKKVTQKGIV